MITEHSQPIVQLQLFEILDLIEKTKEEDEAVNVVLKFGKRYSSFLDYLRCVYDDRIKFLLPDGKPPYTPADPTSIASSWHKKHLYLKYFVLKGVSDDVGAIKRERMFIDLLESIHPEDALIVCDMIQKKSTVKKLNKELVNKAFPGLCE